MKKVSLPGVVKKEDIKKLSIRSGIDQITVKKILSEERKYFKPLHQSTKKSRASKDPGTGNPGPLRQSKKLRKK